MGTDGCPPSWTAQSRSEVKENLLPGGCKILSIECPGSYQLMMLIILQRYESTTPGKNLGITALTVEDDHPAFLLCDKYTNHRYDTK